MHVNKRAKAVTPSPLGRIPNWLEQALQGVTFWIGHRQALYRHRVQLEGAIVGEMCTLIQAHLDTDEHLSCEEFCVQIAGPASTSFKISPRERVDLVVKAGEADAYVAALEVKRASESSDRIRQDLRKLARLKKARPDMRAFLVIVSQSRRPKWFVDRQGKAKARVNMGGVALRTRRVCSASAALRRGTTAHYAVAVEVL